jgi:hypothetical protein
MAWALLLLPELTYLVLVSLLLRHLVILFLETGSLTTLLLHDVLFSSLFFLGALYSGQSFCIYMGCTDIVYMTLVVYGWFWFSFMVMCLWLCVWMYVYGCMFGYVFGVCVWIPGLDPPRGLVQ